MLGIGVGKGENRAIEAARSAMESRLIEHPIENASSLILNITAPKTFKLQEMQEAAMIIRQTCSEDADMKFGVVFHQLLQKLLLMEYQVKVLREAYYC